MASSRLKNSSALLSSWCLVAAFGAYFSMYAFRKPFTVARFEDLEAWGLAYKPLAVVFQVFGYMASKFIGVRVIAELEPRRRVPLLLAFIGVAELALVAFAVTPAPWNLIWLAANGLPLGMVFGLVLGFLEGRRHTEALAAGLCVSFILADGFTKWAGAYLLQLGVSETWMPAGTGMLFLTPVVLFSWMLAQIPPPNEADVAARSARAPMNQTSRREFLARYGVGLCLLVGVHLLITVLRSVRSDFAPEIWEGLGVEAPPGLYAKVESLVALGAIVLFGLAVMIKDNRRAFFYALGLTFIGCSVLLVTPAAHRAGASPMTYMVLQGIGIYLPYMAVHTAIFERLVAMTRERGNIGYLMYLADAFGYLGYVAVLLVKTVMEASEIHVQPQGGFFTFYNGMTTILAVGCLGLLIPCWRYFALHPATRRQSDSGPAIPPAAAAIPDGWSEAEAPV